MSSESQSASLSSVCHILAFLRTLAVRLKRDEDPTAHTQYLQPLCQEADAQQTGTNTKTETESINLKYMIAHIHHSDRKS